MPASDRARIALSNLASGKWTAGLTYQRNLLLALRALGDERPEVVLVMSGEGEHEFGDLVDGTLRYSFPQPGFFGRWARRVRKLTGCAARDAFSLFLKSQGVDALFCVSQFGPRFDVPLLSWIADFQHVHLPDMFTVEERDQLDEHFAKIAQHADVVVVSSQDARKDFEAFAPDAASKARVMSFVSQPPEGVYDSDPRDVCERYRLPERFFYLPNQFWKHKNHHVVLQALAKLKSGHPEIVVVCTGNTHDHRNPQFFSELLFAVSDMGLRDRFIVLGLVPYAHIFLLMRQSLAVLQPSLFEGWNSIVEEAKSIGKGMLLSDIPVLREQDPPCSVYFDSRNPDELAARMVELFDARDPGPDLALEQAAREALSERTKAYGETFMRIAREAMAKWAPMARL